MKRVVLALVVLLSLLSLPPLTLWLTVSIWGTPHIVTSYTFHDNGDRHNPRAPRRYITCTYWGTLGTPTLAAKQGHCPWVRFLKPGDR